MAGAPSAQAASLQRFGSCEELTGWYRDSALERVGAWGLDGGGGMVAFDAAASAESAGGAAAPVADQAASRTGGAVGSSGTGTNVQEEGVDEPSRVKLVDGLAYTLTEDRLLVVDTVAGTVRGSVDLGAGAGAEDGRWFSDLLLVGDRVVVLGSASLPAPAGSAAPGGATGDLRVAPGLYPSYGAATTTMTTVDVSDPAAPAVLARTEVEGGYVSARADEGVVRVVTTASPVLPFVDPWLLQQERTGALGQDVALPEPDAATVAEAEDRNEQVVRDATAADWLPDLVSRDADGTVTGTEPVACGTVAHPGEQAGTGTLTVLTLDPAAGEPLLATTSVSADGSLVYASTDRLYVATTRGGWTWGPGSGEPVTTQLHGFATTAATTSYLGSGSVDGWLLGPWAMDATDGYLRVGTTEDSPLAAEDASAGAGQGPVGGADLSMPAPRSGSTSSSVVVLRETADGLAETGRADGLGPGELIRSLRWFDDLAVVVTFEQTDPLYTVDLSDPSAPRVLGELKVTGYSGYLHPVGDGVLLGVGQAGDEQGTLLGAKVETYDVGDLAAPGVLGQLVLPGSSSPVEWDSRFFAYLPDLRTAVLPLDSYDDTTGSYSSGLVAVALDDGGVPREAGRWTAADQGSTNALASGGGVVVVQRESWTMAADGLSETPLRTLVVLGAGDLAVRATVDLG